MKLKLITVFLTLFALSNICVADINVTVNSSPEKITAGGYVNIEIILEGDNLTSKPPQVRFYTNRNFAQRSTNQYSQVSIINGVRLSTLTYKITFAAAPDLQPGTYKLPQAYLDLGNGNIQNLKDITVNIVKAQNLKNQQPLQNGSSGNISFTQTVSTISPFLGQQIHYQAQIKATSAFVGARMQDRNFPKMWFQSLGEPKETITADGSGQTRIITIAEALFPLETGEIVLPERSLELQIPSRRPDNRGRSVFAMDDDIFSMFGNGIFAPGFGGLTETKRFTAPAIVLNVRPLPPNPPFQQKYIPVGDVKISTGLDKREVMEGESITLTIKLSGDANLELFNLPDPSGNDNENFKIYSEAPAKTTYISVNKVIQEISFSFAIVPRISGEIEIPTFRILTFNPYTEQYEVLSSENIKINVKANPNSAVQNHYIEEKTAAHTSSEQNNVPLESAKGERTSPLLSIDSLIPSVKDKLLSIPGWVLSLTVGVIAAVFLILRIMRLLRIRHEKLKNNPALVRKSKAMRTAMNALNKLSLKDDMSKLSKILPGYIGDKFMVKGESLTAKEAEELVRKHGSSEFLAREVKDIINRLEQHKYGSRMADSSASFTQVQLKKYKQEVADIIRRIDSASR